MDGGAFPDEGEHALEAEAEAEAADEDAGVGLAGEPDAGELREEQLGGGGGGAHELAAVELEKVVAVVLVQGEERAVRGARLREILERFQGGRSEAQASQPRIFSSPFTGPTTATASRERWRQWQATRWMSAGVTARSLRSVSMGQRTRL